MSDPDRRHSSGASDYDAIFADIVAHLNDDQTQEQAFRPATHEADPSADSPGESGIDSPGQSGSDSPADSGRQTPSDFAAGQVNAVGQNDDPQDQAREPIDLPQAESPLGGRDPWSVLQPPLLPRQEDLRDQRQDHAAVPENPVPQVWRAHEVEDYEDHFQPPAANPLPAGDLQFWAIIAGMGGGPLLLLYLVFFNRDASSYWILTAIALCVGGFALLVSRMPGNHDENDDGARL